MPLRETKAVLVKEALKRGFTIQVKVTGNSMYPSLKDNDVLTIKQIPHEQIKIGDIVIYSETDGPTAHRVYRKLYVEGAPSFITKGDNSLILDCPIPHERIVGKAISVKSGSRITDLEKPLAKMWGALFSRLSFASAWIINAPSIIASKIKDPSPNRALRLELGGILLAIESEDPALASRIKAAFGNFETEKEPEFRIILKKRYSLLQRIIRRNLSKIIWKNNGFSLELPYCRAEADLKRKTVFVTAYSKQGWGDFLRLIISILIVEKGGFLLHASGVADGKYAYVFAGPSESGKTTIARLANDRKILSDETVAMVRNNGSFLASSTPFYGEFGRVTENSRLELKGLYFLRKGQAFEKRPLSHAEAFRNLFPNMMNRINDPRIAARALENAACFVEKVKCYELHFLPTPDIWSFLDGNLEN